MINLKISCASFIYTSNPLQPISRTAIARLMQDLHDIKFKYVVQVYMCQSRSQNICMPNGDKLYWPALLLTAEAYKKNDKRTTISVKPALFGSEKLWEINFDDITTVQKSLRQLLYTDKFYNLVNQICQAS